MIISIDFDGTIVENKYPDIGNPIPMAIPVINAWKKRGHTIIINSCRCGIHQARMEAWLIRNHVPHDYINENAPERIAQYGCDCRKISADIYIDDKSIERVLDNQLTPIHISAWMHYAAAVAGIEKTLSTTAQESPVTITDDQDIILGHNPLKSPLKRSQNKPAKEAQIEPEMNDYTTIYTLDYIHLSESIRNIILVIPAILATNLVIILGNTAWQIPDILVICLDAILSAVYLITAYRLHQTIKKLRRKLYDNTD